MATSPSYISLTLCIIILFMCQVDRSSSLSMFHHGRHHHQHNLQQAQSISDLFNEYLRGIYQHNVQRGEHLFNPADDLVMSDGTMTLAADLDEKGTSDIDDNGINLGIIPSNTEEPTGNLKWLKREVRQHIQTNKRMLCFFHAVNCFG